MADEKRRKPQQDEGEEPLSEQEFTFPEGAREDEEGFTVSEEETSESSEEGEETAA